MSTTEHTRILLTVRDAARAGRISEITVRRALAAGDLRALGPAGHRRIVRIDASEFDAWICGAGARPRRET